MNTQQQYKIFLNRLSPLSDWQLIAVAVAICERNWPNYALFAEISDSQDDGEVRQHLDRLWDYLEGNASKKQLENMLIRLEKQATQLQSSPLFGALPAHDAVVTLICTINTAIENDPGETAGALTLSLVTIGKFIKHSEAEELNGIELQQYIEKHPLHLIQLDFIEQLLGQVCRSGEDSRSVRQLQQLAKNDGVGSLGIE